MIRQGKTWVGRLRPSPERPVTAPRGYETVLGRRPDGKMPCQNEEDHDERDGSHQRAGESKAGTERRSPVTLKPDHHEQGAETGESWKQDPDHEWHVGSRQDGWRWTLTERVNRPGRSPEEGRGRTIG